MNITVVNEYKTFWKKYCDLEIVCNNLFFKNKTKHIETFFKNNVHRSSKVYIKGVGNIIRLRVYEDAETLDLLLIEKYSQINNFLYNNMRYDCYIFKNKINNSDMTLLSLYDERKLKHGYAFLSNDVSTYYYVMFRNDFHLETKQHIINHCNLYKPLEPIMLADHIEMYGI